MPHHLEVDWVAVFSSDPTNEDLSKFRLNLINESYSLDDKLMKSLQKEDLELTKLLKTDVKESQNEFKVLYASEELTWSEGQITTTIPHHRPTVSDIFIFFKTRIRGINDQFTFYLIIIVSYYKFIFAARCTC